MLLRRFVEFVQGEMSVQEYATKFDELSYYPRFKAIKRNDDTLIKRKCFHS